MVSYFHINPKNRDVVECYNHTECGFGSDGHFRSEEVAWTLAREKFALWDDWMARSSVPREPGWYIEHVFDPQNEETMLYFRSFLDTVPEGTRLVMENGWVLEKAYVNGYWNFLEGEDDRIMGLKKDEINDHLKFTTLLSQIGGRLEFSEAVPPLQIDWRRIQWRLAITPETPEERRRREGRWSWSRKR